MIREGPDLNANQSTGVVGGRQQVLNDGAHHPESVLLLHEQQQGPRNLQNNKHFLSLCGSLDCFSSNFTIYLCFLAYFKKSWINEQE